MREARGPADAQQKNKGAPYAYAGYFGAPNSGTGFVKSIGPVCAYNGDPQQFIRGRRDQSRYNLDWIELSVPIFLIMV
jgi:hypothetical protein